MINNQRLLEVFDLACAKFYAEKENQSHKSPNWKKYDRRIYNQENLINFRQKGGLSSNCDDANLGELSMKNYAECVNVMGEDYILSNMDSRNIGKCSSLIPYKNILLDPNKICMLCWFYYLDNSLKRIRYLPKNICEIGGGYGCFADILISNLDIKLLSIDLPEANVLTAYYLKEKYPNKSFFLYDDYEKNKFLSLNDFEINDIIIIPPNCKIDERIKLDLFINARSMMEMEFHIIESYFAFINAHISDNGCFLNINRYEKRTVGEAIRLSDYPYGDEWVVIHTVPSPFQKHVHYLLTQKTNDPKIQNIQELLENIRKYVLANPILKGPGGFSPQDSTYSK